MAALVAGSVPALAAPAHAAALGRCSVAMTTNTWPGGFTVDLRLTYFGPPPRTNWRLNFDWGGDQLVSTGWSGAWSQSGRSVRVDNAAWNATLPDGVAISLGAQGTWTTSAAEPDSFSLSGIQCTSTRPTRTTTTTTTRRPTTTTTRPATTTTTTKPTTTTTRSTSTTTTTTTTTTSTTVGDLHVANPYLGAKGYVNPEWKANAESVSGGSRISGNPTAIWLDQISDIAGTGGRMGLRDHLDAALTQGAGYVQVVLHDLPGRRCSGLVPDGELAAGDLARYRSEFVDPVAAIEADPKYRGLRIVNVVEPDSLGAMITGVNAYDPDCVAAQASGEYVAGIRYALSELHAAGQHTYQYLDVSRRALLGWDTNFTAAAKLFASTVLGATGGAATVDGIAVGVADYGPTTEPYLKVTDVVAGTPVTQSKWVDWNPFVDELPYAQAMRTALVDAGLSSGLGIVVDTSRNGWGGSARPSGPSTSTNVNTYVDGSRIDRRLYADNWCNVAGAGLGERPKAVPAPNVDAWAWIKPPGESDGPSTASPTSDVPFDRECDPTYTGPPRGSTHLTGAMPGAPDAGAWFPAAFTELMANAWPALPAVGTTTTTTTTTTTVPTTTTTAPTTTTTTGDARLDNPYLAGKGYVNPEWKANADAVAGGSRVSDSPTAIWLNRIADIGGADGRMGLREHLDAALAQKAGYIQVVLYDLPYRRCNGLILDGELGATELARYRAEFVDPIAAIEADPKYANLRIINIVEPDSLALLVTGSYNYPCQQVASSGAYVDGVRYALSKLHAVGPNTYQYLDGSRRSWLGWDSNFGPAVQLLASTVKGAVGGTATVDGIAVGVRDYSPTTEPFLKVTDVVNGSSIRQSKWVDWNTYVDQLPYAQAMRTALVNAGFSAGLGIVLDTSRNGWGGPDRPTATSTSTQIDPYVDQSRTDRRITAQNWCNQPGAGLGERPKASPVPNVDAWAWIKPPGESDGASTQPATSDEPFDRMCDPTYAGNVTNSNHPSGAAAGAPPAGQWFPSAFTELMANAWPPLPVVEPRIANPYAAGKGYVNPVWKANAESVAGGDAVSGSPTAVWLNRLADVTGANGGMSLRDHLDAALAQQAAYVQFVLHDLPGRDCTRLASGGDFSLDELGRYQAEFVDAIAAVEADPKYGRLRIVNIVEPFALADLVTSASGPSGTTGCTAAQASGAYIAGVRYALGKLPNGQQNTYQYLDASKRARLGWDTNFAPGAQLLAMVASGAPGGTAGVTGVTVNVADYGATVEPYFKVTDVVGGLSVRSSTWLDWNQYADELSWSQAFRNRLVTEGFRSDLGIVIDTSRNGWGGPARPSLTSAAGTVDAYVDGSRIDRRITALNWCNQEGAGLGERPAADPGPAHVHAWAWIKPPGESDGAPSEDEPVRMFNPMCDPTYLGGSQNAFHPTGAMVGATQPGQWFPKAFQQLLANAWPPVQAGGAQ